MKKYLVMWRLIVPMKLRLHIDGEVRIDPYITEKGIHYFEKESETIIDCCDTSDLFLLNMVENSTLYEIIQITKIK